MIPYKLTLKFDTLLQAARLASLALIETKHNDGTPAYVVCAIREVPGMRDTAEVHVLAEMTVDLFEKVIDPSKLKTLEEEKKLEDEEDDLSSIPTVDDAILGFHNVFVEVYELLKPQFKGVLMTEEAFIVLCEQALEVDTESNELRWWPPGSEEKRMSLRLDDHMMRFDGNDTVLRNRINGKLVKINRRYVALMEQLRAARKQEREDAGDLG